MEQLKAKHKVKKVVKWELEMEKVAEKQQVEVKLLQQRQAGGARTPTSMAAPPRPPPGRGGRGRRGGKGGR